MVLDIDQVTHTMGIMGIIIRIEPNPAIIGLRMNMLNRITTTYSFLQFISTTMLSLTNPTVLT